MADKSSSRYKSEVVAPTVAGSLVDGIIETMTFGLAKAQTEVKVTDTKTGETRIGYGDNKSSARAEAHSKFKR